MVKPIAVRLRKEMVFKRPERALALALGIALRSEKHKNSPERAKAKRLINQAYALSGQINKAFLIACDGLKPHRYRC